jgi:hypothetical protein
MLGGGVGARLRCESQEGWIATQRSLSEAPREAVLQQFDGRVVLPEQRQCGSPRVGESVWFSRAGVPVLVVQYTLGESLRLAGVAHGIASLWHGLDIGRPVPAVVESPAELADRVAQELIGARLAAPDRVE